MLADAIHRRAFALQATGRRHAFGLPSPAVTVMLCTALICGCHSAERRSWQTEDVAPKREQRKEEVLAQFESQRDAAQFAAATSRFELGDIQDCREILEALLKRNPQHTQGQQLLAKVQQCKPEVAGEVAAAAWNSQDGATPRVARATAVLPIVDVSAAETDTGAHVQTAGSWTEDDTRTTDCVRASHSAGPPHFSASQNRLSGSQSDASDYHGGARTDVARRSVLQAIEALAVGNDDGAATYYRAAAAAEPRNLDLRLAAAAMLIRYEQYELALEMAHSAQSLQPGDAAPYRTLGTIHYRQGDYRAAYESLSRAISLDKAHPLSYFLMGSTLRKLGEIDKAEWHFRQATELDPQFSVQR
jgi:tetratricopeptide (TPR) repeat protein